MTTFNINEIGVRPGVYEEVGGQTNLVVLDVPATIPGFVMVAKADEDWRQLPELRWRMPEDRLVRIKD